MNTETSNQRGGGYEGFYFFLALLLVPVIYWMITSIYASKPVDQILQFVIDRHGDSLAKFVFFATVIPGSVVVLCIEHLNKAKARKGD